MSETLSQDAHQNSKQKLNHSHFINLFLFILSLFAGALRRQGLFYTRNPSARSSNNATQADKAMTMLRK